MKSKKFRKLAAAAAAIIAVTMVFSGCKSIKSTSDSGSVIASHIDTSISAEDIDVGYDEESTVSVSFADGKAEIKGEGASAQGENVTIKQAGTYILSGTTDNGRVIISADKDAEIKLVLNGVDITCSDNSPIYISKAKKVYMVLNDGKENSLTDGKSYSLSEDDANADGCIFSKANLTINGGGTLNVNGNYKHGIVSKDDLVITDGIINVTSASTALEGKDCVKISGGTFKLSAGSNGIKSTNTEEADKGFISISGGTFDIVSNNDAIEAEKIITVEDGSFDIKTGGGSANASMKSDGMPNGDWRQDMGKGGGGPRGQMAAPDGGETPPEPVGNSDQMPVVNAASAETDSESSESTDDSSTSAKAIKAAGEIKISGGTFKIDSADDSLHCNG
ncbi:MAG: carbohydrate-binding domain-containing protein, partial [Oscillospiraceae bacterium]